MERNIVQEVKVGATVLAVLALMAAAVFLLGGSTDLLEGRFRLNASYSDISGLREGAVVRLAGIDVGEVTRIRFHDEATQEAEDAEGEEVETLIRQTEPTDKAAADAVRKKKWVSVQFSIMDRYQAWIRSDSVASIQTEGVLGDKYISVSVGSTNKPTLSQGDWIKTNEPLELLSYMAKATEILDNAAGIARKVNFMLGEDQDSARASLASAIVSLEALVKQVETGDGVLHALLYDERLTTYTRNSMANLEQTTASLNRTAQSIEHGDGIAHELVYGTEGERLARELADLAGALQALTRDIQNDQSVLHALIYDEERATMVEDLHATATALREVSEKLNSGEGTAGLLANDPTLYEDLQALVGGAQRNKLLRAYIRRTIEKSEEEGATPWESSGEPEK